MATEVIACKSPTSPWPRFLWDRTSREFFDPATVRTEIFDLPQTLSAPDVISLSGAPKGSLVKCSGFTDRVSLVVENETLFSDPFTLTLADASDAGWEAHFHFLKVAPGFRRKGINARMFTSTVRVAWSLGIRRFRSLGLARSAQDEQPNEDWSGAFAAIALGWDARLPQASIALSPADLRGVPNIQGLLQSVKGQTWWAENPCSLEFVFDPKPDSDCVKRLRAYTAHQHIRMFQ